MKKSIGGNTILYPTPVLIVGTYDAEGRPNVMTVAWGGICCSDPPCVAIALRKGTYTYGNIVLQKEKKTAEWILTEYMNEANL